MLVLGLRPIKFLLVNSYLMSANFLCDIIEDRENILQCSPLGEDLFFFDIKEKCNHVVTELISKKNIKPKL